MNMNKLNTWLAIVANMGVLCGLVVLVVELNQNTEVAQVTSWQDLTMQLIHFDEIRATNSELAELELKMLKGEDLSELEHAQILSYVRMYFMLANTAYSQYDKNLINDNQMAGMTVPMRTYLRLEFGKQIWNGLRGIINPGFVEYVEKSMREREPDDTYWSQI